MTMPAIFFGHGNPLNAIQQNGYTEAWAKIGRTISRPQLILCVSAHWYIPKTAVTTVAFPRTIHDFGGFPPELYKVRYNPPGSPALAEKVKELLSPVDVELDTGWGLDHGSWSVLIHLFPEADIPVVQLSIDETKPPQFHYDLAKKLAPLRDEGVLVCGSGNLIHNLHAYAWGRHDVTAFDWALRFEEKARTLMRSGDHQPLIEYETLGRDALFSVPTPRSLSAAAIRPRLQREGDEVSFPLAGFDGGSISMTTVQIG